MNDQFKRILNLVRRTGDTMIVTDPDGKNTYVVMDLDQYELMLDVEQGLSNIVATDEPFEPEPEVELSEPITQKNQAIPDDVPNIWDMMQAADDTGETWNTEQMAPEEIAALEQQYQAFAARNVEQAIEESGSELENAPITGKNDHEDTSDDDDEFGEEQFYLEPVE